MYIISTDESGTVTYVSNTEAIRFADGNVEFTSEIHVKLYIPLRLIKGIYDANPCA